ncbi:efflux RND transporter permease subunit [Planctomycetaceae bacterium]|jgi:hydrophobic/amphiphilic exporter-1 (mainly G- bacteria), HAE1 family|nr:efflux RND transporter permease subunit [Planctomycetaceae bacterium]MDC0308157.1 efflux RND transporter permease subunit [Planctomycetaceae bacterium]
MKSILRWSIDNTPAMNTILVGILAVGVMSAGLMNREVFPEFELEILLISVPYPGASPEEVEEGICQKLEESVASLDGIKKQTSIAAENVGSLVLELETTVDPQKVLSEVRSEVDRISTFPRLAEDPEITQITFRDAVIQVGVIGPEGASQSLEQELALRNLAEEVRDELRALKEVSQPKISAAKNFQIDVEIPEQTLREYGLSLQAVSNMIARQNMELPGGTIKTPTQDILVKGDNKVVIGDQIAQIPLVTTENGGVLTVGDLGVVQDGFADITSSTRLNGKPGQVVSVERTADEDLLVICRAVREYVEEKKSKLPAGYDIVYWGDQSVDVQDRMDLLTRNGMQGLILVLIVLALFLDTRLACWVALGIPISILGACGVLLAAGQTLNMLTMFAFMMALGIVVDDAIVLGENISSHRSMGKNFVTAAIDGAAEVIPSVMTSIATTVMTFMPLFFVTGVMGKFIACMPLAMIAMLVISLLESIFILPCHLAHVPDKSITERLNEVRKNWTSPSAQSLGLLLVLLSKLFGIVLYPVLALSKLFGYLRGKTSLALDWTIDNIYLPGLKFSIRNAALSVSLGISIIILTVAVRNSSVSFIVFPKLDSKQIVANVSFPNGTPANVTEAATARIKAGLDEVVEEYQQEIEQKYRDEGYTSELIKVVRNSVGYSQQQAMPGRSGAAQGGHVGSVDVELIDPAERPIKSDEIIARWRTKVGPIAGADSLSFGSKAQGPGGNPIEFKMLSPTHQFDELTEAVEKCKDKLGEFPGVFDISDDSVPGKWEYKLKIKEEARVLGVTLADLAETVRASYFGQEVMRLQRGRHEVKLMVRYPAEDRRSLKDFENIRVRLDDGSERPLTELAEVTVTRSPSEINRVDQLRSITISADVDDSKTNARQVVQTLQDKFVPGLLEDYPGVTVLWEGQQEQTQESMMSLVIGLGIAMICMFALLTFEFKSYIQPAIIMAIIPFGFVGAILGHWAFGLPLTMFSMFGLVALTGVVVNDSIVLVDFINHRINDGSELEEALLDAGRRRLRPILLTSVTTVAGLIPLMLEKSFQAQLLIPMAVSLAFGLLSATIMVLYMVPTFYSIYAHITLRHHAEPEHAPQEEVVSGQPAAMNS